MVQRGIAKTGGGVRSGPWVGVAVAVAGLAWTGRYLYLKREPYTSAARMVKEMEPQWPSYVIVLKRL